MFSYDDASLAMIQLDAIRMLICCSADIVSRTGARVRLLMHLNISPKSLTFSLLPITNFPLNTFIEQVSFTTKMMEQAGAPLYHAVASLSVSNKNVKEQETLSVLCGNSNNST